MDFYGSLFLWLENFLNPYLDDSEGLVKIGEYREKCDKDR